MRALLLLAVALLAACGKVNPDPLTVWLRDAEPFLSAGHDGGSREDRLAASRALAMRLDEIVGCTTLCGSAEGTELRGMGEMIPHRLSDAEQVLEIVCYHGAAADYTAVVVHIQQGADSVAHAHPISFPILTPSLDSTSAAGRLVSDTTSYAPGLLQLEPTGRALTALAKGRARRRRRRWCRRHCA